MSGSDAQPKALIALTRARKMLAEAKTIQQILAVENLAQRARDFAKAAGAGRMTVNVAVRIMLDARRKAGDTIEAMRERGELASHGGERKSSGQPVYLKPEDLGMTKKQARRYVQEASVPEDTYILWWDQIDANTETHASATGLRAVWRQLASPPAQRSVSRSHQADELTLQETIDRIRKSTFSVWEKSTPASRTAIPNVLRSIADELEQSGRAVA